MSPFAAKIYLSLLAFIFGTVVGSFLNVVIWRLPRGEYLSYPGSHCPKCGHKIRPWENIPILSWVFLGGRCSSCHLPISWRYPAGESATGLLYFWIFFHILQGEFAMETVPGAFWLAGSALAAGIIDAEHKFIPNKITYPGLIAAAVLALCVPASRFVFSGSGHSCGVILEAVVKAISGMAGSALENPRVLAGLDCALGILAGGGILGLFSLAGRAFGRQRSRRLSSPVASVLTQDGLKVGNLWECAWPDVITSEAAVMTVQAEITDGWKGMPAGTKGALRINARGISLNGIQLDWEHVRQIKLKTAGWSCPFQILGLGDVKFMAMAGAFLGADAAIYILFAASVLGVFAGILKILLMVRRSGRFDPRAALALELPFGPFLAIPVLAWLLFIV